MSKDKSCVDTPQNLLQSFHFEFQFSAGFKRPVVVFGPLADIARERLAGDYYGVYETAREYYCDTIISVGV